jgi:hypothetical protein
MLKVNDKNSRIRIQDPDPNPDPDPLVRSMDPEHCSNQNPGFGEDREQENRIPMLTVTDYCTIEHSKKRLIIMVMIESIPMLTLLNHMKKFF